MYERLLFLALLVPSNLLNFLFNADSFPFFFPLSFSLIAFPPFLTVTLKTVPTMNAITVPVKVITLKGIDMSG